MSAGAVDVRAVLREYARDTGPFRVTKQGATNLASACAAVAELIDACKERDAAQASYDGISVEDAAISVTVRWDRLVAARARYAAALAHVGGVP